MYQLIKRRIATALILFQAILLAHIYLSREIALFSILSDDKKFIAQITMTRDFPYLSVQGYLVVRDLISGAEQFRYLLVARDVFEDVALEVQGIHFDKSAVVLEARGVHYSGPKQFSLPKTSETRADL